MTDHAVVIAGGGPTGLMLAGELALAGTTWFGPPTAA
jgi:3-(3-hydroxy-phenyl)propionate hydroxylase